MQSERMKQFWTITAAILAAGLIIGIANRIL
jgi:hypothetical protein